MLTRAFGQILLLLIDGSMNYELNIGDFVNIINNIRWLTTFKFKK